MKKVKFMLLSLALVAVVGGALAFKVKTTDHFCSTIAREIAPGEFTCLTLDNETPLDCPNFTIRETVAGGTSQTVYCTTPDISGGCSNLVCNLPTKRTIFTNK